VGCPNAGSGAGPTPKVTVLERIASTRSLHELWHLRGEVFDLVSLRHDQATAKRCLQELDRHFAKRSPLARWRDASSAGASAR